MIRIPLLGFALLCSIASPAKSKQTEITLKLSSQWQLDYGVNRCRLAGLFGEEGQQSLFYIEQRQPSAEFSWLFAGPQLDRLRPGAPVSIRFGSAAEEQRLKARNMSMARFGNAISSQGSSLTAKERSQVRGNIPDQARPEAGLAHLSPEGGREIDSLSITVRRTKIRLEFGSLEEPFVALNSCMEDFVKYWGLQLEEQRRRVSGPVFINIKDNARKIQANYPLAALRKGEQAIFNIRMIIDENGDLIDCNIDNITNADAFGTNERVCDLIREHGEFEPARDSKGRPIKSYLVTTLRYVIG